MPVYSSLALPQCIQHAVMMKHMWFEAWTVVAMPPYGQVMVLLSP